MNCGNCLLKRLISHVSLKHVKPNVKPPQDIENQLPFGQAVSDGSNDGPFGFG